VSNTDNTIIQVFSPHMEFNRVLMCTVIYQHTSGVVDNGEDGRCLFWKW